MEEEAGVEEEARVEEQPRIEERAQLEDRAQGKQQAPIRKGRMSMLFGFDCAAYLPDGFQCMNRATITCEYCTDECRASDLENHKSDCPPQCTPPSTSPPTEIPDHPTFDTGVFWANYAATDVLNLAENEGAEYDGLLKILLLGTFGLRHLFYSVDAMPRTAFPSLEVTISEMEIPHLFRTLLSLLLILRGEDEPFITADAVTYVCYSYRWPGSVRNYINEKLKNLTDELSDTVSSYYASGLHSKKSALGVKWGSTEYLRLEVFLDWLHWKEMLDYLDIPFTNEDTNLIRAVDVMRYGEPLDRAFARMSPSRVAAMMRWRQNGLLLPHGDALHPFRILNPTFYPESGRLSGGITNEPLSEWPMKGMQDYMEHCASEDIYGKAYTYVRDMVASFQLRLRNKGMRINLMAHGTTEMAGFIPKYFPGTRHFDRIEVGHLFDIDPQLCLLSCSPMLRHEDENPFATMLAMTRESVIQSGSPNIDALISEEKHNLSHPVSESLDAIMPPVQAADGQYSAASVPRHLLLLLYRNWDLFSDRYLNDSKVFGFPVPEESRQPRRSVLQTGYLGLQLKTKNKITVRWPNRLVFGKHDNPTKEDVMRWMSWPSTKPERWLEWKKVGDVGRKEWLKYLAMVEGERAALNWVSHYVSAKDREEESEDETAGNGGVGSGDPASGQANKMENDDWMEQDAADHQTAAYQGDKANKAKKKKKYKK
ncbi:hypothetical protein TARUN_9212 [Trichoderma arundinaceum]|uniref:DUF4470 domain-containing protein n=1 Tax=Trichoderma arundinaceum TaxID=490622 RepID=A0A395NAK4_TRIAR|nr:hypothetical protein TARUN_9212 [Trichoderma arundinaceum]